MAMVKNNLGTGGKSEGVLPICSYIKSAGSYEVPKDGVVHVLWSAWRSASASIGTTNLLFLNEVAQIPTSDSGDASNLRHHWRAYNLEVKKGDVIRVIASGSVTMTTIRLF